VRLGDSDGRQDEEGFIEQRRREGTSLDDAVIDADAVRFRPAFARWLSARGQAVSGSGELVVAKGLRPSAWAERTRG